MKNDNHHLLVQPDSYLFKVDNAKAGYPIDETIHWADIEIQLKCNPEQFKRALHFIRFSLGYLPERQIYIPHLAFIQVLVGNVMNDTISAENFTGEMLFHTKRIRNDDMKKNGWMQTLEYAKQDFDVYDTYLPAHKQAARQRLSTLIGYEPAVEHSLQAEILLRQQMGADPAFAAAGYREIDHRAVTITIYRETFLLFGEDVADKSEVMGLIYDEICRNAEAKE